MKNLTFAVVLVLAFSASAATADQTQPAPPPPPPPPSPPPSGPSAAPARPEVGNTMSGMNEMRAQLYTWDATRLAKNPVGAAVAAENVADCVIQRAKDKVGTLVGGPSTADPKFNHLANALAARYSVCTDKAQGMPLFAINSSLAEALIRRNYPIGKNPLPAADLPASKAFYDAGGNVTIDSVARCIAVHSPALVYGLVTTKPGSAEEAHALSSAYSQTPACGVGATPSNIPVLEQRAAFAVALYSWMQRAS